MEDFECDSPLQATVRIDDIVEIFRPLAKPRNQWKADDIANAIPVLKRRIGYIAGGCSPESCILWDIFVDEWLAYLDENLAVKRLVDPDFVAFDFNGGAYPPSFAADVAASDARLGVAAIVRVDGTVSNSLFAVASPKMAAAFMGRMKALHPGVFCTVFASALLTHW